MRLAVSMATARQTSNPWAARGCASTQRKERRRASLDPGRLLRQEAMALRLAHGCCCRNLQDLNCWVTLLKGVHHAA